MGFAIQIKENLKNEKGQIIDASIVQAPKQRNSREENAQIKEGEIPQDWEEAKRRQKDSDAQWTKRNGKGITATRIM
jgi:transposase, IS5 family